MGVKVITPPTQQIPTAELRAHCRIDGADEDALLVGFLAAAVGYAEHYTGRAIGEQTLELALDEFPGGPIALPKGPIVSIASVKYIDPNSVEQTLAGTFYAADDYGDQGWAIPAFQTVWPQRLEVANAIKVRYVAGSLPAAVKSALLLFVGHLYARREATSEITTQSIPLGVNALLNTVKVWGV